MTYGIKVYNSSGDLICDGNNFNLAYHSTISNTNVNATSTTISFSTSTGNDIPFVYMKFESSTKWIGIENITNSNVTLSVFDSPANTATPRTRTTGTTSIDIYTPFRNITPTATYGIQLYNASSELIYENTRKIPYYANVVELPALLISNATVVHNVQEVNLPSGMSQPWVSINNLISFNIWKAANNVSYEMMSVFRTNGTKLQWSTGVFSSEAGGAATEWVSTPRGVFLL